MYVCKPITARWRLDSFLFSFFSHESFKCTYRDGAGGEDFFCSSCFASSACTGFGGHARIVFKYDIAIVIEIEQCER